MHPPYHADDPAVHHAIELLGQDPLVTDKVANHDRSFGYNSAPGYIDEDSVEALEEIISEEFGAGRRDPRAYWQQQDGGMHVLAAAIYAQYKPAYAEHPMPYWRWLVQAVEDGRLRGEKLAATVKQFFAVQ